MATWFLKECPKCGGDLYLDPLVSGDIVKCLQCGLEVKLSFVYIERNSARPANLDVKVSEAVSTDNERTAIKK